MESKAVVRKNNRIMKLKMKLRELKEKNEVLTVYSKELKECLIKARLKEKTTLF